MKLILLVMVLGILQVNAESYGQTVTLTKKNAPLTDIFKEIRKQTNYDFIYSDRMMEIASPVTVDIRNLALQEALVKVFSSQPLTYIVDREMIIVRMKISPKQLPQVVAPVREEQSQEDIVRGKVMNNAGEPVSGVTVMIANSNTGTKTDDSGNYSLQVPTGNSVLHFSSLGYASQEVPVNRRQIIDVVLQEESSELSEIVVTALGIKREARSLSYSSQTITADKLNEAKETNMINSLQGKVAGVTITRSATGPGGSSKVLLRGSRSIYGNNQPLYVIDGVPLDNTSQSQVGGTTGGRDGGDGIGMLNSDDIESMTVLKGASAAALYGSQGQNGAIIITTKRGKAGRVSIDYSGNVSFDQPNILPEIQTQYGQGSGGLYAANSETSWGPKIAGQEVELWNGNTVNMAGQPNRLKQFFRTAQTYTNTVNVMGGTERVQTYFSYGNTQAQGILRNHSLNRHNFDFKLDNKIGDKLSFFSKLTYIVENVDNKPYLSERIDVVSRIYRAPVSIPLEQMQRYEYFDELGVRKQSYWKPGSVFLSNPYWALNRHLYFEKKDRVLGLFSAKYEFNDWLDFQIRGSLDKTLRQTDERMYEDSYHSAGQGAVYALTGFNSQSTNLDGLLSFRHDFTPALGITGYLGGSIQERKYSGTNFDANGLNRLDFFFIQNAKNPRGSNYRGRSPQVQSLYATATLSYNNYLFLDVTARNDWSSALPKENRSYFYPSIGLTSILTDIVRFPSWVSYGKVRLTYANAGYGGTEYLDRNYFSVAPGGAITTPRTRSLGNYKPELTTSFEAGLDWRFFQNRFGIDLTYYRTRTKNQLLSIATPYASLFVNQYINAGLIQNDGVEISLSATPVRSNEFSWNMLVNFAKNNNRVIRLTDELRSAIIIDDRQAMIRAEEGGRYGDMYMVNWRRDEQGRRLVDDDGRVLLTGKDSYVGNYNPNYMLGINNILAYKGISLSFLIDYRNGGTVISGTQAILDADGHSVRSLEGRESGLVLDAYTEDGQKNTKSISAESYWASVGNWSPVGDLYAYSGTNLRLREVALGFSISERLLSRVAVIKAAKISLVGRNLFFFMREAPFDPEIAVGTTNTGGIEFASLPSTRNFGLNLKVSF
ncbi:SusC/RagA family TonB-linked outer membrane protein [Parapedobacter lycopersici]|uniref:SusC/RagA family TonB-linked outer membrane protein n=1 Tax=Parapedobacter lycopersici TaxID=1864939 RepID=UPI0033414301